MTAGDPISRTLAVGFSTAREQIKGQPHAVRVERFDLRSSPERGFLQEEYEFEPGGKKTRYTHYRPDGRQSHREEYEYAADGRLLRTTVYGESDAPRFRWSHSMSADGRTRESVAFASDGTARERCIETLNNAGQILECESIDLLRNKRIDLKIDYDPQGRPLRGATRFEANPELNMILEWTYLQGGECVITLRREAGELLAERVETGSEDVAPGAQPGTVERVDARDDKGNWTQMSILRGAPSSDDEPEAILRRDILYY